MMKKSETKVVEIGRINKLLVYIDDDPSAPVACPNCLKNKWESFENMTTGQLEFVCLSCKTRVGSKLRTADWDVM
jgi:hypothetical protein